MAESDSPRLWTRTNLSVSVSPDNKSTAQGGVKLSDSSQAAEVIGSSMLLHDIGMYHAVCFDLGDDTQTC